MNLAISPLAVAVGWAVLHFLWQGLLIGLGALIILRLLRKGSAQARYVVALSAIAVCGLAFVATFLSVLDSPSQSTAAIADSIATSLPPLVAATLWIFGVSLMAARLLRQAWGARQLRTISVSAPAHEWREMFDRLKTQAGIAKGVQLLESGLAHTPMVVGWLSPIVLVPSYAFCSMNPEQLRAILAHELAHIRRYDHWANLFQAVIEALLFFHPVVWWLSREARSEREFCCDAAAVRWTGSPVALARALTQLEASRLSPQLQPAATDGSLKTRITRLIEAAPSTHSPPPSQPAMKSIASLYLGLASVILLGIAACSSSPPDAPAISADATPASEIPSAPDWLPSNSEQSGRQVMIKTKFIEIEQHEVDTETEPYTLMMTDEDFQTYLRALSSSQGSDLMSAPSIVSREGQRAKIEVIREFIFPTDPEMGDEMTTVPTGVTNTLIASATNNPNELELDVFAQVIEFAGYADGDDKATLPLFTTQTADSTVTVENGQTVVFGGMTKEHTVEVSDSVPVLGSLPLIGRLFSKNSTETSTRELIITVTPQVIDAAGNPIKTD